MVRRKSTSVRLNNSELHKSTDKSAHSKDATTSQTQRSTNLSQNQSRNLNRGTKILREIRKLQRTTKLLIPKSPFSRLIHEILQSAGSNYLRITSEALAALHEALEMYLVQFFEDSNRCALHAKRKTVKCQDMHLVRSIRGPGDVVNK